MALGRPLRTHSQDDRLSGATAAESAAALQHVLGHSFRDEGLLATALTHPSVDLRRRGRDSFGYERLEFLGDRVLGMLVAEMLLEHFPNEAEGDLAKRHAVLVGREILAEVALEVDLGPHLRLSAGESEGTGRRNPTILADALEAVIAALYYDGGLNCARDFIQRYWTPYLDREITPPQDPKTALQEYVQGRGQPLPVYRTVGQSGPAHEPVFEIEVRVAEHPPVVASASTKRGAEKAAAEAMLKRIRNE
jgi:ribonuclease-3